MARQPSSGVFLDDSLWPLLIIRFVGELSHAQFEEYLRGLTACFERGERHISLMDASQLSDVGFADQRRWQVEWMNTHGERLHELLIGSAIILRSPFLRLALRVFLHIKPLSVPYVVVSEMHEAVAWAAGRFEEVGLPLPAQRIREHFGLPAAREARSTG